LTDKLPTGTELLCVELPIRQTHTGTVNMLYDSGSTISLIKLNTLKDETLIYEDRVTLTGVTGHKIQTIGKIHATIKLNKQRIKHSIYVVRDDFPIEQDGILGIDFLRQQSATCDYARNHIAIGDNTLKLHASETIHLRPRSETIIRAITDQNFIGFIQATEITPGVYTGNSLVKPENFKCFISVINTTNESVEIRTPVLSIEKYEDKENQINLVTTGKRSDTHDSRNEQIWQLLRTEHLNKEEKRSFEQICEKYADVFHLEGEPLMCTTVVNHEITTRTNTAPINVRPYRLPEKHKIEINKQFQKMLDDGIIQPSVSQWNAPLLTVPKKVDASGEHKLRIVIDFRKLNELMIGDSFPLPNITDILDQLGNAKYFSTLDLASGYHQIPMATNDKQKTAFSTPYGHYEFNRMSFGLKNAPATFQRLMNSVLTGLQGLKCFVYLDDIVIYVASLEDHNKRLKEVLKRLQNYNLKLQPNKCEFLRKEVMYLGHVISEKGISPDPSKLEAIQNFPIPKRVKDVQSFIGLAGYYRRFIENFSKIAKPLTKLTQKN